MAEVAAHVTDHVLPHLPVRQWVLSLPKRLRPFLEGNTDIASAVLRIFIRAVRTTLCRTSPDAPRVAQLGALSFFHRFGSRPRRVLSTFTLSSTTAWKWEVRVEHPALARLHDVSADGLKFLASVPQAEGPTVLVSVSWTAGLPPVE